MELKPIPFSPSFFASWDGRIFDRDLKERTQYENGDGYKTASVLIAENTWRTFTVQRLIALAHKPIENPEDFVVNHRDLDKSNNWVNNLEWLTVEQNNLHAALFRENPKKPVVYIEKDGHYVYGYNVINACAVIGCSPLDLWDAVLLNNRINGFKVVVITNKTRIPKELRVSLRGVTPVVRPLRCLNILTEEVFRFNSVNDAGRYFKVGAEHVSISVMKDDKFSLFKGKYVIVREDDEFPDFDKEELLSRLGSTGFPVLIYDQATDRYEIHQSASRFIKEKKLSKKAVTTRLKNNKVGPVNGFYFAYYRTPNKEHLFEVIGRPGP